MTWLSVSPWLSWLSVWSWWSLLASAALGISLTSSSQQNVEWIIWSLRCHLYHLSPHVSGTRLAVLNLSLNGSLKCLHIVENEWESDEHCRDGDCREGDSDECDSSQRTLALLVHSVRIVTLRRRTSDKKEITRTFELQSSRCLSAGRRHSLSSAIPGAYMRPRRWNETASRALSRCVCPNCVMFLRLRDEHPLRFSIVHAFVS